MITANEARRKLLSKEQNEKIDEFFRVTNIALDDFLSNRKRNMIITAKSEPILLDRDCCEIIMDEFSRLGYAIGWEQNGSDLVKLNIGW